MVIDQLSTDPPYLDIQEFHQQDDCDRSCEDPGNIWPIINIIDPGANEMFDPSFADGAFHDLGYRNMSSMQRFLQEKEKDSYFAGRRVFNEKQPRFEDHPPMALEFYSAPHPWPQGINTAHGLHPQDRSTREWAPSDQESCSVTTGNTWSPQPTESCTDHDPRYPYWSESPAYPVECVYPVYGSGFGHGPAATSPHSITGTLSEIQQCPDTEAESESMRGSFHAPFSGYPSTHSHINTSMVNLHRDEGVGSSINESAIASPASNDAMAVESVSGDGGESDYSPRPQPSRATKKPKGTTKSPRKGSTSPNTKRSSMTKGNPHQLTSSAKVTKRTTSTTKSSDASLPPAASHASPSSNANSSVCPYCCKTFPSTSTLQKHVLSYHTRPFHCSFRRYGCTSTFGSKNEWKRHVSSQHLCPGIYRCDIGACVPQHAPSPGSSSIELRSGQQPSSAEWAYNDFNRKDLFTQHIRRMHGPGASVSRSVKENFENGLEAIRRRCWRPLRDSPPKSICGYCASNSSRSPSATTTMHKRVMFSGKGSWDDRMEHVGRHLEKENPGFEVEDLELRDWMVEQGLLVEGNGGYVVTGLNNRRRSGRGIAKDGIEDTERHGDGEEDADGEDE
ncbi:MAG: hypothetical protein Q9219_002906 [cf. Caloplaca sp. 3 TL-2023]